MIGFSKLQGAGNDFIIVDNRANNITNKTQWVLKGCDRHFGVGADGFMFVETSQDSDIKMDFWNADGSHSTMCGNGIRCFSKFIYDEGIVQKDKFTVETGDGVKIISMLASSDLESVISVDMGTWAFSSPTIESASKEVIRKKLHIDNLEFEISCVHMGVPHGIIYIDEIDEEITCKYGSKIEKAPVFPQGMNVNFVNVLGRSHIEVDTWERGAGKTLACGTGSCASVITSHRLGKVDKKVLVDVPGGQLKINLFDENVTMEGKATIICKGTLY